MKKRIVIIILVLFALICGLTVIQTRSIFRRVTKDVEQTGFYTVSFEPDSLDQASVGNVTDKDCIDTVSGFLKEASFRGFIFERNIVRTPEKHGVRVILAAADNKWYEVQLTDEAFDECYIRPLSGLYSERCHIKIGNCQDLYEFVRDYTAAHQTQQK